MTPFIGITTSFENQQQRLDHTYVTAVRAAQGQPMLLPLVDSMAEARRVCDPLQGFVIPGGPGITANMIGSLPAPLSPVNPKRWKSDNLLLDVAIARNLPILGICYGMQLLAVRAGGTLYADVETQVTGTLVHSEQRGALDHALEILPNTHLARIWDLDTHMVNSRHFQAVCDPGTGYLVSARSTDGTIEAIERIDGFHIGVQFHPERMGACGLFRNLVQQALCLNKP